MTRLLPAILLLSLAAAMAAPCAALAQEIYVVDIQRVINESIAGKAARNNVETELKKTENKLGKAKADLEKMQADLQKQSALLAEGALEEKKKAISKAGRALEQAVREQKEDLLNKNNAEISRVVAEIDKVIKELGSSGNYGTIIERDPRYVLYANPRYDLTDEVIKRMDSKKTAL